MKNVLFLAWRYLRFNKIKTAIMIFSIAVGVFLPLAVNLLVRNYQRGLLARAEATPLVAGALGSRLDLVLHALYFRGKPARDLTMADVATVNSSGLALGIPILEKHLARGYPIVGTSLEYFDYRGLRVAQGEGLTRVTDCVLGSSVAESLRLKPGDKLPSDPENLFDLAGSYPVNMVVKGVLAPTGTADDGAIFTDYKTEWMIEGIMHGHDNVATVDTNMLLGRTATNLAVSDAVLPYQEINETNMDLFHVHGDEGTFPVSAIIIVPHDTKSAAILRGRYEDPKATVQILVSKDVISETLNLVFAVKRFFDSQAALVGCAMALLLALVVLLSLRLRRGEMETMFKIGCARWMTFGMQAAEVVIVVTAGVAIASGLTWLVVGEFGISTGQAAAANLAAQGGAPASTPSPGAKPRVAVSNYPLWYFTHRIAGDHVQIVFPIPKDEDPSFWKPDANGVRAYQQTDLILLNGADCEKWRLTSVLPLSIQVNTSASFADRYMTNGEVITHSHGKEGLHSHGVMDFNTWMDPRQAKLHAQSVHDELVRLLPAAKKDFDANLQSLDKDLDDVDAALERASVPLGNAPLLASHPVYHYAARRFGWNLENVHWEPDEMPSEDEWQKFEKLYASHPGKIMIWEDDPVPACAERLRKMGVEPVAFDTCASEPEKGDYISAMKDNAARFAQWVAKFYAK
ncbi:MAG: zinc ABC transporter substrate-binding protein [Verrucomicrobiota bacterium]|jgi:putative ABC transport system permease protein